MKLEIDLKHAEINKLEASLRKFGGVFKKRSLDAMERVVDDIMTESFFEAPVETRALRSSAFVERSEDSIDFGYAGPADRENTKSGKMVSEYMLAVHERLDVWHPVGKAKFFEDPINRHKQKIESTLARILRLLIGR